MSLLPLLLAALGALAIGAVLGLLGGGGAILTLPLLVYALHVEAHAAIATSLVVVGATSLIGSALHARSIRWRAALPFGAAGMAGAFAGGRVAHRLPGAWLLVAFGLVMVATGIAMLRPRRGTSPERQPRSAVGRPLAIGAAVGALSGLVGAGGGFLIVPALTLVVGLSMRDAIGTSLAIIAMQSLAGFAGHALSTAIDWRLAAIVIACSTVGTVTGVLAGRRIDASSLRRAFAGLVLAAGVLTLAHSLAALPPVPPSRCRTMTPSGEKASKRPFTNMRRSASETGPSSIARGPTWLAYLEDIAKPRNTRCRRSSFDPCTAERPRGEECSPASRTSCR